MPEGSRSTKRRRSSTIAKAIVILDPGEELCKPAKGQDSETLFTRVADFWLEDGNLILLTATTVAFRIYQDILVKKSTVFADMFNTGSPDATETVTFDDCPVVGPSDHLEDLHDFI